MSTNEKNSQRVATDKNKALEAVLRLYRDPERLPERLTTLRLLTRSYGDMAKQAARLVEPLRAALDSANQVEVVDVMSQIGSGSLPVERLRSVGIAIRPLQKGGARMKKLESAFRSLPIPVLGYVREGAFHLDLRCLAAEDERAFVEQLRGLSC